MDSNPPRSSNHLCTERRLRASSLLDTCELDDLSPTRKGPRFVRVVVEECRCAVYHVHVRDENLRKLESRWKETETVEDEVRYLVACVRRGLLAREQVALAAYVG